MRRWFETFYIYANSVCALLYLGGHILVVGRMAEEGRAQADGSDSFSFLSIAIPAIFLAVAINLIQIGVEVLGQHDRTSRMTHRPITIGLGTWLLVVLVTLIR
jgi:hypothetical protein